MLDYKTLLEKYIQHVYECEGSDFTVKVNGGMGVDIEFSEDEARELKFISEKLNQNPY